MCERPVQKKKKPSPHIPGQIDPRKFISLLPPIWLRSGHVTHTTNALEAATGTTNQKFTAHNRTKLGLSECLEIVPPIQTTPRSCLQVRVSSSTMDLPIELVDKILKIAGLPACQQLACFGSHVKLMGPYDGAKPRLKRKTGEAKAWKDMRCFAGMPFTKQKAKKVKVDNRLDVFSCADTTPSRRLEAEKRRFGLCKAVRTFVDTEGHSCLFTSVYGTWDVKLLRKWFSMYGLWEHTEYYSNDLSCQIEDPFRYGYVRDYVFIVRIPTGSC